VNGRRRGVDTSVDARITVHCSLLTAHCSLRQVCNAGNVRVTIDPPNALFRRAKAVAALRGSSIRDLIVRAVEREVAKTSGVVERQTVQPVRVPLIHLKRGRKLDLTAFDFDDLLA
jgi:hypothetical protein